MPSRNLRHGRRAHMVTRRMMIAVLSIGLLGGCATMTLPVGNWQSQKTQARVIQVTLPAASAQLAGHGIQASILNAMEFAEQNRFAEARLTLDGLRAKQSTGGDGYRALTASMALLALRAGDMTSFRRDAGALDRTLTDKVRVEREWVEVIALYRSINGGDLPVNTPPGLRRWLLSLPTSVTDAPHPIEGS